jgi:hypothetical protein
MKQHAVALLLQPYKNRLMEPDELKKSVNGFAEHLLGLAALHPNFHFNVVLPAYLLECINPLLLSNLREMHKRGCLEWLLTGYTEPFFAFSPASLTESNIRYGMQIFTELTGAVPAGFLPAFSSWEPSYIALLAGLGLNYSVLSGAALPHNARSSCGYWFTEQGGEALALFPSRLLHGFTAPADFIDWLDGLIAGDGRPESAEKIVTVHYLLPLQPEKGAASYRWLKSAVAELDKHLLRYRAVLLQEARSLQKPIGVQHLPSCLPFLADVDGDPHFYLNRLHSFDQVGILQRKMMDIADRLGTVKERKLRDRLQRALFYLQDINRYLPGTNSGFTILADRMWTYGKLIDLEAELREFESASSGRIRITDFLRNGNKSIIMSNAALAVYCDYKSGGHVYELDYLERRINLTAAFNPQPHMPPDIVSPGASLSAFIDRLYAAETPAGEIAAESAVDIGSFADTSFEYKIKKSQSGVKAALKGQGGFPFGGKIVPLSIEKVFGLEKDEPIISYVYQLSNHSLSSYAFIFAVELHLSLPGTIDRQVRLINGKTVHQGVGWGPIALEKTTKWSISDFAAGVRLQFITQKPLDVYCLPLHGSEGDYDPSCGFRLVLTSPVALDQSSSWTLVGSIACAKIRKRRKETDAV